jgi:glycosyltransferase involved in cell wall biosynthesis
MKVLTINKFFKPIGGPETIMFDTIRELKALGHSPIPFAMSSPDNLPSEYSEYFVPNVEYNSQSRKGPGQLAHEVRDLIWSPEARRRIDRLITETKPDLAHAHNIYHQLSPSILGVLKKAGIPTVLTFHDGKPLCANMLFLRDGQVCERCAGRWFHHAVINRCVKGSYASSLVCSIEETVHRWSGVYERNVDLFISPSYFLKDKLTQYGRFRADQIEVLPNYADTKSISPNYEAGSYGLFIGKIEAHKGVRTLLNASLGIRDFGMKFAGRGPLLDECSEAADKTGAQEIRFLGFQVGNDLIQLLRDCRFVVLPAEWYENCPMVILEAFAAGKPVIASRIGGIPELIEHDRDGLLFEPGNTDELASCMRRLIDNPELAVNMGRSARAKVEANYSIESYMRSLLQIYDRLLSR